MNNEITVQPLPKSYSFTFTEEQAFAVLAALSDLTHRRNEEIKRAETLFASERGRQFAVKNAEKSFGTAFDAYDIVRDGLYLSPLPSDAAQFSSL